MARIAGVDLPNEKRIEAGLTYIYGIGWATSKKILEKTGINPDTRVKDLTEEEAGKIRKVIESDYMVEGDLRRDVNMNIKRLMDRMLQRYKTQKRSPCKRTENKDERQNKKRS